MLGKNLKNVTISDNKSRAMDKAKDALEACNSIVSTMMTNDVNQIDQLTECFHQQIKRKIDESDDEVKFQTSVRKDISSRLRKYICRPSSASGTFVNSTTTESVRNTTWSYNSDRKSIGISHPVHILFESDHSSVRLVKDFITKDKCLRIIEAAKAAEALDTTSSITSLVEHAPKNQRIVNITSRLREQNDPTVNQFLTKVSMLLKSTIGLEIDHYTTKDDALMNIRIVSPLHDNAQQNSHKTQDCEISSDGSCVETISTTADVSSDATSVDIGTTTGERVTEIESSIIANIIIICDAPPPTSSPSSSNDGMIYFPNAGVRIVPNENIGDAILIQHANTVTGEVDIEPYVNEYITCPVQPITTSPEATIDNHNNMLVTIEDSYE
jgi:hypothetical protein